MRDLKSEDENFGTFWQYIATVKFVPSSEKLTWTYGKYYTEYSRSAVVDTRDKQRLKYETKGHNSMTYPLRLIALMKARNNEGCPELLLQRNLKIFLVFLKYHTIYFNARVR